MRILLLMDPFLPVPPLHYGGIERVVYDLANRYVKEGHDVTLVAGPNSRSPGRLIIYGENGPGSVRIDPGLMLQVHRILAREAPRHDVLHNFGRLAFLFPAAWRPIRKVQTYMRFITARNIAALNAIRPRNLTYTAVSDAIVDTGRPGGGDWRTVYNCAPIEDFDYVESVPGSAPLVFLGRLERCKGAHSAITVAELSGRQLIIAGNVSALPHEKRYFEEEIKPRINGRNIRYIGVVNNEEKNRLLGNAAALLLPIEWLEPFPVVLPEAFACGTPVLAFARGGVPEGVIHGITGFLSDTAAEMAAHVGALAALSRQACRAEALNKYSDRVIADHYLSIYSDSART